jgi:hypothetical protein
MRSGDVFVRQRTGSPAWGCGSVLSRAALGGLSVLLLLGGSAPVRAESPPPAGGAAKWSFTPLIGVELGPLWRLGASPVPLLPPAAVGGTEFALDVTLGGLHGLRSRDAASSSWRTLWLLPQLGYSFATTQPVRTDLFVVGLGVGVGSKLLLAAYTPRLVAGSSLGESAVGVRQGLAIQVLDGLFGVELAHQWLHLDSGGQHDLRLMFRVNAGMLLIPLLVIASGRSFG